MLWWILGLVLIVVLWVAYRAAFGAPGRRPTGAHAATPAPHREQVEEIYPGLSDSHVLARCPQILDGDTEITLREWLRHVRGDDAWTEVVAEFYDRAAQDPAVAEYFADVELAALQRHFLAALMVVTGQGVTVGVVRAMATAHEDVVNLAGRHIDAATWDKVVGALVATLVDWGVPDYAIGQLAETIAPLKPVIVTQPSEA